jgi:hypothetical protein
LARTLRILSIRSVSLSCGSSALEQALEVGAFKSLRQSDGGPCIQQVRRGVREHNEVEQVAPAGTSGRSLRTNWFIVIEANGKWWVDNEGHAFGPFPTREIAALEAVDYAKRLGDPSRASLIYWPDADGKMKLIREL